MSTSSRGFTLAEALLAMLLLALGLLATAPMFVHAMRVTAAGGDLGAVGVIAVERMELLRSQDFFALNAGGSLTSNVTGFSDTSQNGYTVRWAITDNATPPTIKLIEVRVIAERQVIGQQKEVTLTSVRAL